MNHDDGSVGAAAEVELDLMGAESDRLPKRRTGVLRGMGGASAVGGDAAVR
jgi:hypothetical protein